MTKAHYFFIVGPPHRGDFTEIYFYNLVVFLHPSTIFRLTTVGTVTKIQRTALRNSILTVIPNRYSTKPFNLGSFFCLSDLRRNGQLIYILLVPDLVENLVFKRIVSIIQLMAGTNLKLKRKFSLALSLK